MPGLCSAGDRTRASCMLDKHCSLSPHPNPSLQQHGESHMCLTEYFRRSTVPEQVAFGILSSDDRDSQFPCCHVTVNSSDLYSVHSLIYRTSLPSHPTPSPPPLSLLHHCHRDPKPLTKGSCHPQCHREGNVCALSVVSELTITSLPGS